MRWGATSATSPSSTILPLAEAARAIGTAGRTGRRPRQPADGCHFGRIQPALSTVFGAYETNSLAGVCVTVITGIAEAG